MYVRRQAATWRGAIRRSIKGRYVTETADYDRDLTAWNEEKNHIDELLFMARHLDKVSDQVEQAEVDVRLKSNERLLLVLRGSGVVELKANASSSRDEAPGLSYPVTNGVSYRSGAHDGTHVSVPEIPRVLDAGGTAIITTSRVLYTSPNRNRAWEHAKTVDVFHSDVDAPGWGASYLRVSNRKKTSGFIYPSGFAGSVRDRLVLALAIAEGSLEDMLLALKTEKAELERL